jgi:hypothetical protein
MQSDPACPQTSCDFPHCYERALQVGNVLAHDPVLVAAVLLQALVSAPPPDPDASTRMDLTHLTVYTVDDASTTEVDDGLSITTDEDGAKLLWVHVADPTRWLTPGARKAGWGATATASA